MFNCVNWFTEWSRIRIIPYDIEDFTAFGAPITATATTRAWVGPISTGSVRQIEGVHEKLA